MRAPEQAKVRRRSRQKASAPLPTCISWNLSDRKGPTWRWRRGQFRGFLSSGTPSAQDSLPADLVVQLRPRDKKCFSSFSLDLLDYHFLWSPPGLFSPGGRNRPSCGNPDGDYSFTKMMKFSPGPFSWDFLLDPFSLHFLLGRTWTLPSFFSPRNTCSNPLQGLFQEFCFSHQEFYPIFFFHQPWSQDPVAPAVKGEPELLQQLFELAWRFGEKFLGCQKPEIQWCLLYKTKHI